MCRDIKPENILLTADKVLKMADFGLSINSAEERPVTRAGTLDYMSPEVLRCPEKSLPEENKVGAELRGHPQPVSLVSSLQNALSNGGKILQTGTCRQAASGVDCEAVATAMQ